MHKLSIWKWRRPRLQQSIWIYSLLSNNLLLVLSIVHVFRWSVCDVKSWFYRKQPFVMAFSTLAVYCYCSLQISIAFEILQNLLLFYFCVFFLKPLRYVGWMKCGYLCSGKRKSKETCTCFMQHELSIYRFILMNFLLVLSMKTLIRVYRWSVYKDE